MKNTLIVLGGIGLLAVVATGQPQSAGAWPQGRGPDGTGAATRSAPPTEWSETKNIRWKRPIPGRGHATPIIWGARVYVQTAVPIEPATETQPGQTSPPGATEGARTSGTKAPP